MEIPKAANICPHCRKPQRNQIGCFAGILIIIALFYFFGVYLEKTNKSNNEGSNKSATTLSTNQNINDQVPTPQNLNQKIILENNRINEIEKRYSEINQKLKKYYATDQDVAAVTADASYLNLWKNSFKITKPNDAEILKANQKVNTLLPKIELLNRKVYASKLENIFMEIGMDVKVSVIGKTKKTLNLKYALMSQPMIYKFHNEYKINELAKNVGFNKIIYTNGFESDLGKSWEFDLKN
jgi:hypothetical protein